MMYLLRKAMTDDYVSFETAKLLKEAGFIVFCDKYFVKPEITDYYKGRGINANWNALDEYFSRPTLSLAAKWLREENNIYVEVISKFTCWKFSLINLNPVCIIKLTAGSFNTYEEALEEGLKEALERICKVKSST